MGNLIAAAAVCGDGTLGSMAGFASSARLGLGVYNVVLAAPVVPAQVSAVVTPVPLLPNTGTAVIQPDNVTVRVETFNMGVPVDSDFSVGILEN